MTTTEPCGAAISFATPPWLHDHAFTIREVSETLAVPFQSIHHWLHCLKWQGFPLTIKRRHRRLVTGHGMYVLGVLAALYKQGIPVTPALMAQAMVITHDPDGNPKLPEIGEQGHLAETDLDGTPIARIEIELWAVWASLESKLMALIADTETENS